MGRHKLWRAQVKKLRRKRQRQKKAQERDDILEEAQKKQEFSPTYQAWLEEQEVLEQFREEEEARLSEERQREWERAEREAQQAWCLRQERAEKAKKEREEQELRIRKEWEEEQRKIKLQEEEKMKEQEEKQKRQDELMKEIIDFVDRGGERPLFADNVMETNPNMPVCPFFTKTGACRFGDRCSRNHPKPALSKVVLLPNFYSHFGMDQSMLDEYDSDLLLEYEDSETYQHFREFYNDVVPELYRYGQPVAVVICCNAEPHLRGNVYVEYAREAESAKAVTSLNGRWYGGKVLSAQFTNIPSWKAAICGLFHRGRCPKGKACNFLHVFQNPGHEFSHPDRERQKVTRRQRTREESRDRDFSERHDRSSRKQEDGRRGSRRTRERSQREWRWSESPERMVCLTGSRDEEKEMGSSRERERGSSREREGRSPEWETSERMEKRKRRRDGRTEEERKSERRKERISHGGDRMEGKHSSARDRHSSTRERHPRSKETNRGKDGSRDRNGHHRYSKKRRGSMSKSGNKTADRERTKGSSEDVFGVGEDECEEEKNRSAEDLFGCIGEVSNSNHSQKHEDSHFESLPHGRITDVTSNGSNID